ncbi:MAG: hypothetical protein IKT30_06940 [Bacteroidaceae bacterium]|nr:hypothetical protein [Bacteroidaceae bacterium]
MLPTTPYQYAFPSYNPIQNIPEIQYVNSPESADAYNLPPNKTVVLFNQNNDEFYIVSVDASGSRTRNDFTFKPKARNNNKSEYVTRSEFRELKNMVEGLTGNKQKYSKKEEVADHE